MSHARPPLRTSVSSGTLELVVYIQRDRWIYPLPQSGVVNIGRSSTNEIRLDHRSVSREHIRLHIGDKLQIEDVGSANGTYLFLASAVPDSGYEETLHSGRNRQVEPGVLTEIMLGDMIRVGAVMLSIQKRAPTSRLPVRPPTMHHGTSPVGPPVLLDPAMKDIYDLARKAAVSHISILILGETGVGKDVLAETIHRWSPRASAPFVRLNCAALSETLLESELFGYQRGAFTGATEAKEGLLESAHRGTVFLDEIGELPMSTQVKLLHVLESGEVLRVGSTKPRRIDVRFIAATNRDLTEEIRKGRFRKDLYFRINGVNFTVPPLRKRQTEIIPMARHFLKNFCQLAGMCAPELSEDAVSHMLDYGWPGNVRELKNAMERAPIMCGSGPITARDLPSDHELSAPTHDEPDDSSDPWAATTIVESVPEAGTTLSRPHISESFEEAERARVLHALEVCGGNQSRAAKMLGMSRRTLVNRLDQYRLPRPRKTLI